MSIDDVVTGVMPFQVVNVSTENETIKWDRYVQDHPHATGYHLSAWRKVVTHAFGHQTFYFMAQNQQGEVRGVLPLVLLSSKLFGRFLVSMPFVNYGGVLADSDEPRDRLLTAALAIAQETDAAHLELRQQTPDLPWLSKRHKVSMHLPLPRDFDTLWKAFPSKLRSQIRRAQREEMTVRIDGVDLLDPFYEVFSRGMRDLGTPVYGKSFFRTILETFNKEARIVVVSRHKNPLAVGFVYGFGTTLEIPWAASDRRYNRFAPNMLLYNSTLEYACREGFRVFDFGRSTVDSGTFRFKQQWGAEPIPLYWYYWLKEGNHLPELNPQNQKYRLAVQIWKQLPLIGTKIIGPSIAKHLP